MRSANRGARGHAVRPRRPRHARTHGQSLVELALMVGILLTLSLGVADFGRAFGNNEAVNNAAREAARQATYYNMATKSYPNLSGTTSQNNTSILHVALQELGCSSGGVCPSGSQWANLTLAPSNTNTCPATLSAAPPLSEYPATDNTGWMYICYSAAGSNADGKAHVQVTITWRMGLYSNWISTITGPVLLHGVVDATEPS